MRIYRERIPTISGEIVQALIAGELVEVEPELVEEVELDVASVLKEYRRTDWELAERARDIVANRNLDYSYTHKIKGQLAAEKKFSLGEDAIGWITAQILEILLQSNNVEEIYGEDHELRRVIAPVLRKELGVDDQLDVEVKKRIKNLQEGTTDYEIEYQKTLDRIRTAKRLKD